MTRRTNKLSATRRTEKRQRREQFTTVMMSGRQTRMRRPPTVEGIDVEEFFRRNATAVELHQEELWHLIDTDDPPLEAADPEEDLPL